MDILVVSDGCFVQEDDIWWWKKTDQNLQQRPGELPFPLHVSKDGQGAEREGGKKHKKKTEMRPKMKGSA